MPRSASGIRNGAHHTGTPILRAPKSSAPPGSTHKSTSRRRRCTPAGRDLVQQQRRSGLRETINVSLVAKRTGGDLDGGLTGRDEGGEHVLVAVGMHTPISWGIAIPNRVRRLLTSCRRPAAPCCLLAGPAFRGRAGRAQSAYRRGICLPWERRRASSPI